MGTFFKWSAFVAFAVSAGLWFVSTLVKVDASKIEEKFASENGGWKPAQIVGHDGSDFYATVQRQSKWSRWASLATAVALALQAVATAIDA